MQRNNGDPYRPAASQISNLPFVSRKFSQPAPLFYSATDEFREEDDEMEHEREVADFYALQRSRRHFGSSHLKDSSELDSDQGSSVGSGDEGRGNPGKGKGIRSSWRGGDEAPLSDEDEGRHQEPLQGDTRGGNLVDVGLDDTSKTDADDADESPSPDVNPPLFQPFRDAGEQSIVVDPSLVHNKKTTDRYARLISPQPPSSTRSYVMPVRAEQPLHDAFWANIFLLSLASLLATEFLVSIRARPTTTRIGATRCTWPFAGRTFFSASTPSSRSLCL